MMGCQMWHICPLLAGIQVLSSSCDLEKKILSSLCTEVLFSKVNKDVSGCMGVGFSCQVSWRDCSWKWIILKIL